MANLIENPSHSDNLMVSYPQHHHSGIGFTEWMALGLVVFTIVLVLLAVVINLLLGTPGGLGILHGAAPL